MKRLGFVFAIGFLALLVGCSKPLTTPELLARAQEALAAGDLNAAEVDIKTVLQGDAENATARFLYGTLYAERMNPVAAVEEFDRAVRVDPNERHLLAYARSQLAAGQIDEFLQAYEDGYFSSVDGGYGLGSVLARAYVAKEDYEQAREQLALAETQRFEEEAAGAADPVSQDYLDITRALFKGLVDKDVEGADEILQDALERSPRLAEAWSLMGVLAGSEDRLEEAAASYAKAAELNPRRISDRVNFVNASLRTGDIESASAELARLEKMLRNSPAVNYLRGQLAFGEGDYKTAIDSLSRVLSVIPDHPEALLISGSANAREGNLSTSQRQLTKFLSQQPEHLEANLQLARVWWKMGDAVKTEDAARSILKEHDMNVPALSLLALALSAQGLHAESADVYDELAILNPASSEARMAQGAQKMLAGDADSGLDALRRAVELDADSAPARERLIAALVASGYADEAWSASQDYVKSHADSPNAHILAGRLAFSRQDVATASSFFEKALSIDPGNTRASEGVAALALLDRDFTSAEAALDEALAANPGDVSTSISAAALAERQGNVAKMESLLQDAMKTHPQALEPRLALARNAVNNRRLEEAVALLNEVREEHIGDYRLHRVLANAYMLMPQMDAAGESARKLVELRPDDVDALALSAQVQLRSGRPEAAEVEARRALGLREGDVALRRLLIGTLMAQDKRFAAKAEIEQLPEDVQAEPALLVLRGRLAFADGDIAAAEQLIGDGFAQQRNSMNMVLLSQVQWAAGKQGPVIESLQAWLQEFPNDGIVRNTLATRALEIGENALAIDQYAYLVDQYPGNLTVTNNLAWLLREVDSGKALALIQEADEKAPQNPQVKDTYAMIQMVRKEYTQALRLNEQALRMAPEDPEIRLHRAEILLAAGQKNEALILLRELVAAPAFAAQPQAKALLDSLDA
ncbi:MAG: XrtA/PEP-CTERM system TPR-repeat protein PrsT [Congregibacter sp.]